MIHASDPAATIEIVRVDREANIEEKANRRNRPCRA
jgi:hypothetical protein